jgi:hypothetical protein
MLSSLKIDNIKGNIYFVGVIMIISNLINFYLVGTKLFDNKWLLTSFGILVAYIIFSLISGDYISVEDKDYKSRKTKEDAIKYLIIYTLSHSVTGYMNDGFVELSFNWFIRTLATVGGFVSFDYICSDLILNLNSYQILFMDLFKILIAEFFGGLVVSELFDLIDIADLIAYSFSYAFWSLFVKKIL